MNEGRCLGVWAFILASASRGIHHFKLWRGFFSPPSPTQVSVPSTWIPLRHKLDRHKPLRRMLLWATFLTAWRLSRSIISLITATLISPVYKLGSQASLSRLPSTSQGCLRRGVCPARRPPRRLLVRQLGGTELWPQASAWCWSSWTMYRSRCLSSEVQPISVSMLRRYVYETRSRLM